MADESQYSSGPDSASHKRKYEDPSAPRRPTGFSSPPDSAARSYNSVPPPPEGIELAKAKAQEIAARLAATAAAVLEADSKRLRVENGSSGFDNDKGFSSAPSEMKPLSSAVSSALSGSYGNFHGTSKTIDIPQNRVGVIIGKAGETIKYLQLQSGAKIQVQRDTDADPGAVNRPVELVGTPEQVAKAEQLIKDVLNEAEDGGSNTVQRRFSGQTGGEHFEMRIPNNKVGLVIGKGGETIKSMQARTGARIQVIPLHLPPGDPATERTVHIDGTSEQIQSARELVEEVISENRPRNQSMTGGYSQQGYQAQPQSNWGPPGAPAMQQPGYGYMQPGAYPSQQYSQPPYGAYPGQPASAGYSTGYDQSGAAPNQQSGYDYYNQTPQQTTPGGSAATDNSGYSQPPASGYAQQGQGYYQDGYGGYPPQSGYGQQPAYDQQAYGAAAGYEGQAPSYGAQTDSSATQPGYGAPATSQAGYGTQPPAQSGYGTNGAQKPAPAYGQTQQSPSTTPGSYSQPAPAQPGYPSGYSQQDSGAQRAPPSYGAAPAQSGYPPSYGAPPATQPGYGAQYNAYGGNYAQPPAYSSDGSAAPAASQNAQPGSAAKTSPES